MRDTGTPRWYVKMGNECRIEGGPVALEAALRRATAQATADVPLRPNRVHPSGEPTMTIMLELARQKLNMGLSLRANGSI